MLYPCLLCLNKISEDKVLFLLNSYSTSVLWIWDSDAKGVTCKKRINKSSSKWSREVKGRMNVSICPPEAASLTHVCSRDFLSEKKKLKSEVSFKIQITFRTIFEKIEGKAVFQPVAPGTEDHRRRPAPALPFWKWMNKSALQWQGTQLCGGKLLWFIFWRADAI